MSDPGAGPSIAGDASAICTALRQRRAIADERFDRLYPPAIRHRSEEHWTPVAVALQVSAWLDAAPGRAVLDIGSGVGKACHVGALASDKHWSGVERDPRLVRIATRAARDLGIEARTRFVAGEARELDWSRFGGVYLFNPFDEDVQEIVGVERKLLTLHPGARVVTYYGFGGEMPVVFEMVERITDRSGFLCLWIRRQTATR